MKTKDPGVVYSNVWEDPELNRLALKINPGDYVFSITSGGCNSLCLLLETPQKVVSIDVNKAQNALLEYKKAAIMALEYEDYIEALGVPFFKMRPKSPPSYRIDLYKKIRPFLSEPTQGFWDIHQETIQNGLILCGKVEKFFQFYRWALSCFYSSDEIQSLFSCENLEAQRNHYNCTNRKRWRFLNFLLLNKGVLSLVKGGHSFAQVEEIVLYDNFNLKISRAMRNFLNQENYFMALSLLGSYFDKNSLPPYLLEKNFKKMKASIENLDILNGTLKDVLEKYGKAFFNKFNLSNIFEWMTDQEFNSVINDVISLSKPETRLCFRYTLASPRHLNEENSKILKYEKNLSDELFKLDRSFIYESFHIYHT